MSSSSAALAWHRSDREGGGGGGEGAEHTQEQEKKKTKVLLSNRQMGTQSVNLIKEIKLNELI